MSYMSASENVGFSGISQDATCATQYKMAVESVPNVCSEMNNFMNESSSDEHSYMNDNYFHTKFKIDSNELYTFHDSDVIAGEITVSHTEDNYIFSDNNDSKNKMCFENSPQDIDIIRSLSNGYIKEEVKDDVIPNGHYKQATNPTINKDVKTSNTKVQKIVKSQTGKEQAQARTNTNNVTTSSVNIPKAGAVITGANVASTAPTSTKISINSFNSTSSSVIPNTKVSGSETFLDVFKREQGLVEGAAVTIKTEPCLPPPAKAPTQASAAKKVSSGKPAASKPRRGRGPTMHEALQRIPRRALPLPNRTWHAPGDEIFDCGPLYDTTPHPFRHLDSSSSEDDDQMPNFGERVGSAEEGSAESRGARLALRRAALRRQVAQASATLRLTTGHKNHRALARVIKKQVSAQGPVSRLPTQTVNHLLAMRGMTNILTSQERRRLRRSGWSGGESGGATACCEDACASPALPCAGHCLGHVTRSSGQRLYAACLAVFAGGERCSHPLLPLSDQTPLCAEHAWKRDNYDKISREVRPKKPAVRKRPCPATPRPCPATPRPCPVTPRRTKRRRRPAPPPVPTTLPPPPPRPALHINSNQSLSELNVCSNSSTYDSSEDTGIGGLSETEFIVSTNNAHELEVEQVPPDDILDSAVLGQIPDEAFTEFFNQAEGGGTFAESSELARALEAVLDERALDSLADSLPAHILPPRNKMQVSSVGVEMSSGVSS